MENINDEIQSILNQIKTIMIDWLNAEFGRGISLRLMQHREAAPCEFRSGRGRMKQGLFYE